MSVLPGLRSPAERAARGALWLGAAAVLGALAATAADGLGAAETARLARVSGIGATAVLAVAAQHALFPDPRARAVQLANLGPTALLRRLAGRWAPLTVLATVPGVVVGWGDWRLVIEAVALALAVGACAFERVAGLGERVRAWERADGGGWYRALYGWAPTLRFQVPDPLVPGLLTTGGIFLAGSAVAVAGQAGGALAATGVAAVLVVVALVRAVRLRRSADRAYWSSHAVWSDAFRQTDAADARDALAHDAVYWAPAALRPTVWAGLVGLDRRLPLGRVAAVLLAVVSGAHLAGASPGVRWASVGLYVVALVAPVALTASDALVPATRAVWIGGPFRWTAVRSLMALRWLPPLVVIGLGMVWLAEVPLSEVVAWTGAYAAVAVAGATLVTVVSHIRLRRAFA